MKSQKSAGLRAIPSMDRLLAHPRVAELSARFSRRLVHQALESVTERLRAGLRTGDLSLEEDELEARILEEAEAEIAARARSTLRPVINGTGVILHTNLGRALLPPQAVEAIAQATARYSTLEYDLDRGRRGSRYVHCERLLKELTGAQAALVVNNNAAAVTLTLHTLARGRETVVSRGELVEIGGSFRLPEIMAASGTKLVEVGTTNRTRLLDYRRARTSETALLVKVHRSNFKMLGFVEEATVEELVALGREQGLPVLHDLGSGLLLDLRKYGFPLEPVVAESVKAGATVTTFSGDKLLGGPQAGLIVGEEGVIRALRENPLTRALRVDKMTLAALEATLRLYLDEARAVEEIPTLRALLTPVEALHWRAKRLWERLPEGQRASVEVVEGPAEVGGGSYPGFELPSVQLAVHPAGGVQAFEERMRAQDPPLIGRIERDTFLVDLRTVLPEEDELLVGVLAQALQEVRH